MLEWLFVFWITALAPCFLRGATYTVTTINDSGTGSLRTAITSANGNPGLNTITFNLTGARPFTITLASALPTVTNPIIIDGTTQSNYTGTPVIEINGSNLGANTDGFDLASGGCAIRGLAINRCPRDGIRLQGNASNVVQGNFLGTDVTGTSAKGNGEDGVMINGSTGNVIGGTNAAARNVISGNAQTGVFVSGVTASNNLIEGNYIGLSLAGKSPLGNSYGGITISNAAVNTIGGTASGAGNVISANGIGNQGDSGVELLAGATQILIQGNYIGTDASGSNGLGNFYDGIYIYESGTNTIGGTTTGARNLISGNYQEGISVSGSGANANIIQGNYIGTKADGIGPLGNQSHNIDFSVTASSNIVGGTISSADNRIAFSQNALCDGVRIRTGCVGNFVGRNSIFSNGYLGVVIGTIGTIPNTSNMVTLTEAVTGNGTTVVQGSLGTYANGPFLIQFYQNIAPNPNGYGEGLIYVGSTNVITDANGQANFIAAFPVAVPPGRYISATATDSAGTTWEFSPNVLVQPPPAYFTISQTGPNSPLSINWPTTPTGFLLQQTTNLSSPISWSITTNAASVNGTTNSVSILPSGQLTVYRLVFQ